MYEFEFENFEFDFPFNLLSTTLNRQCWLSACFWIYMNNLHYMNNQTNIGFKL